MHSEHSVSSPRSYRITWTQTEDLGADVSAERLAELLGVELEQLNPDDPEESPVDVLDLADSLAELEPEETYLDGEFTRQNVTITPL